MRKSTITPPLDKPVFTEIACTLHDGSRGSLVVVRVEKSEAIHSVVLNGTWQRLNKGNKELVAEEIAKLSLERGSLTAEGRPADVDFQLLHTQIWQMFASARRLTRPLPEALQHIGLAKKNAEGLLQPTWAAVLLFSEEPSGLLRTKAAIRIFHYKAEKVDYSATPNLVKPPKSCLRDGSNEACCKSRIPRRARECGVTNSRKSKRPGRCFPWRGENNPRTEPNLLLCHDYCGKLLSGQFGGVGHVLD